MTWISYPGGTVLRQRVPATSQMLLEAHPDPSVDLAWVTWRAGRTVLGVTYGAGGLVDLRPAVGARTLSADCEPVAGQEFTIDKQLRIVAATEADEAAYAPPAPARPALFLQDCAVAYGDLERITAAEAVARRVVSGCLIAGATTAGVIKATDCVIEARASVETMTHAGSSFTRCVVTGLEREDDGTPLTVHRVRQHLLGAGYTVTDTALEWMNDGHANACDSTYLRGSISCHTNYVYRGDRQHPDGLQGYGRGGLLVEDLVLRGVPVPLPLNRAGEPVVVTGASWGRDDKKVFREWPGPSGSSGVMLNSDQRVERATVLRRVRSYGTANVHFNLAAPSGATLPDGTPAVIVEGCVVEELTPGRLVVNASSKFLRRAFPSPVADWRWGDGSSRFGDLGPSDAFTLIGDDGDPVPIRRREVLY